MKKPNFIFGLIFLTYIAGVAMAGEGVMKISSSDFKANDYIPQKLSCDGEGKNPTLIIEAVPQEAKSLALIVDDPDAPSGTFVHWVVYDMPVINKIDEDSIPGKQGINTAGRKNYVSPCPPSGTHRYFFKIFALDTVLNQPEGITKGVLEKAMQGHILDNAEIVGLCQRGK